MQFICTECNKSFYTDINNNELMNISATLNCPHCDALLLLEKGNIYNFHKVMHEQIPEWPEDGNGTNFIAIQ
jgi:DNA-directed RNA polymerase subunit RPC12/RpoP